MRGTKTGFFEQVDKIQIVKSLIWDQESLYSVFQPFRGRRTLNTLKKVRGILNALKKVRGTPRLTNNT